MKTTRACEVGVRRYLARILGRDVLLKLKIKLALLLFAALLLSLDADLTFARNAATQAGSATSANEMAGDDNAEQGSLPAAIASTEEHALPQKAVEIARPFGFPITNSMVVSWIVAVGLIIFARVATRDMKGVPGGAQNFLEWLVGGLYDFLESIIGPHLVKRTFWFLCHSFHFHSFGQLGRPHSRGRHDRVGTSDPQRFRGRSTVVPRGQRRSQPDARYGARLLRLLDCLGAAGSGPGRISKELFAPKGESTGFLKVLMIVVFFAAGCLESFRFCFGRSL